MEDKYRARSFDELAEDATPVTLLNEPLPPDNVGVLVPGRQRSLHSVIAQALADTESLIARLEAERGAAPAQGGPL